MIILRIINTQCYNNNVLRITTGKAKNKQLNIPNLEGYRGVQEVAKQAIFAILGDEIQGKYCLDIFAGSGNLGLEALSRGAERCDFVDEHPLAIKAIEENIKKCNFEEQTTVKRSNAVKYAGNTENKYDIIFLDPFYEDTNHIFLMKNLEDILNESGKIIFFHGDKLDINKTIKDTTLKIIDERRFGHSFFTILAR